MGASLGGGAAESAFGSDTNNVLTRGTIYGIVAFFSVAMGLYLMYQAQAADSSEQLAVPAVSELQLDTNTATEVEDTAASDAAETQPSQPAEPLAPAASN